MRFIKKQFARLTKYIEPIQKVEKLGEWVFDTTGKGTVDDPIQIPFVDYDDLIYKFIEDFYKFTEEHPKYELTKYQSILEENNIELDIRFMSEVKETLLDDRCILALIMGVIRIDRFSEGSLLWCFKNGCMLKWLKRLSTYD
ncbi:MAG: hypothetical protein GX666_04235 [Tissierellia bacterium]|nr:hypothetical protein [Tissierellia bacterium]